MSYSPALESAFNDTKLRSSMRTPSSGMCSLCTEDCIGSCEIGLSSVIGQAAVYPTNTGTNQVASEKDNPLDYSIFNIGGHCFGAVGAPADGNAATIFNVNLERTIGHRNPVKMALPVMLPALIKLNWQGYFAAAAMAGTVCVIGEGSPSKDSTLTYDAKGKIDHFPMLNEMLDAFRRYDRGYGQIALQCNIDDDAAGLPEYAIQKCGAPAIEVKFGQSAKGTQPAVRLPNLKAALKKQAEGALIYPDPSAPEVQKAYDEGACPQFWLYGRLPMWTEESLLAHVEHLRELGLKNLYFKTAGFDRVDMERVLRMACLCDVDMVTIDGAGGGSGYSPCKMMNEWGLPAVCIESALVPICKKLETEGLRLPAIAVTGGFASEDQVYKGLALGAPYVTAIGTCRAAMAAAMAGAKTGELLEAGNIPKNLEKFGKTKEALFLELPALRALYGKAADSFPLGAVGAYSYLKKLAFGIQHFAALNRKFDIKYADRSDLIPLTRDAKDLLRGEWFNY